MIILAESSGTQLPHKHFHRQSMLESESTCFTEPHSFTGRFHAILPSSPPSAGPQNSRHRAVFPLPWPPQRQTARRCSNKFASLHGCHGLPLLDVLESEYCPLVINIDPENDPFLVEAHLPNPIWQHICAFTGEYVEKI